MSNGPESHPWSVHTPSACSFSDALIAGNISLSAPTSLFELSFPATADSVLASVTYREPHTLAKEPVVRSGRTQSLLVRLVHLSQAPVRVKVLHDRVAGE